MDQVREFRKAKFFWLDNEVVDVYLPKIGGTAFQVYTYLCRYVSNETQCCMPSMDVMAGRLQLSKSTIWRSIEALELCGMISVQRGKRGGNKIHKETNTYRLLELSSSSAGETRSSAKSAKNDKSVASSSISSSVSSSISSSATVLEQDLYNNPIEQDLILSSPSSTEDGKITRFTEFKDWIFRFYNYQYERDPLWDASDAKQLSALLASAPKLDGNTFALWLKNYGESTDHGPGERPRSFLPRISNYSVTSLNQYGRSVDVQDEKGRGVSEHNSAVIAKVFGGANGANGKTLVAQDQRTRGKGLEPISRLLLQQGD